jgi:hypothetical protein
MNRLQLLRFAKARKQDIYVFPARHKPPFNYTDELMTHSFYGRIVGLLLIKLKSRLRVAGTTEIKSGMAEVVGKLSPQEFLDLIGGIC